MKKTLAILLAFCLCVGLCACGENTDVDDVKANVVHTEGDEVTKDNIEESTTEATETTNMGFQYPAKNNEWEYDVYGNHIILTKYIGKAEDVVIPDTLEGLPVQGMRASDATGANGCFSGNQTIKKVTLSKNIHKVVGFEKSSIEILVFANDEYIEFDNRVFNFCDDIQNVDEIIAHIPGDVFPPIFAHSESDGLYSVTIPDRFTEIDQAAFWGCRGLRVLDIGNVAKVEEQAFGSTFMEKLIIRNKDCVIYGNAFSRDGYGRFDTYAALSTKNLTIYAPAGSDAAFLASEHNIDFSLLEE